MKALGAELEWRLRQRRGSSVQCARFVESLLKARAWLFEFVTNPKVEGTNNRAERALRPCVVARKISSGSRTWRGARVYEVLMSVLQSLRLRGQDFLEWGPRLLTAPD